MSSPFCAQAFACTADLYRTMQPTGPAGGLHPQPHLLAAGVPCAVEDFNPLDAALVHAQGSQVDSIIHFAADPGLKTDDLIAVAASRQYPTPRNYRVVDVVVDWSGVGPGSPLPVLFEVRCRRVGGAPA
jgi:hypothetical protein